MCIWTQHIRCIPKTFLRFPVLPVCIICLLLHNINKAERLHSYRKGSDFIGKLEDVTFNGMYHKKDLFSESIFSDYVGFEDCDLSTLWEQHLTRYYIMWI